MSNVTSSTEDEATSGATDAHRLRLVLEASGAATWELDVATGTVTGDARHAELLGLRPSDAGTLTAIFDAIAPEDRQRTEMAISRALAGEDEGRYSVELRTAGLDGSAPRWLEGRGKAYFNADGHPVRIMGVTIDVTRRKQAEEALRESEAWLQFAIEAADIGTWHLDLTTDRAPVRSLRHDQMFGYDKLQSQWGQQIAERHVLPDDVPAFREAFQRATVTGVLKVEFRVHWPDGSVHWILAQGRAYAHVDGRPTKMSGTASDVTAQKEAEAKAQAERKKLYDIFEQAPVLIAIVEGPAHTFTFANPAYRQLIGDDNVMGKTLADVVPDVVGQGFDKLLDEVMASGIPYVGREMPTKASQQPDAETGYFDFVYQPLRDSEGQVRGVLGCGFDVTAQVRMRRQAEAASAQLEAVFQAFPEPLYFADKAGIKHANAAGLALFGASSLEELQGPIASLQERAHIRRADTGTSLAPEDDVLWRALQGQTSFIDYIVRHAATGEDRVLRGSAAPVRVGGEVVGAVSLSTDITERVRAERALKESAAFERQLIGVVSHDLRNPLNAILLAATTLLRRGTLDPQQERTARRMLDAAERMRRMVRDLLDFTQVRLSAGLSVQREPRDLHALTRLVVDELRVAHPNRQFELTTEGDGWGAIDADRIAQVIANLLSNAVAYGTPDSPLRVMTRGEDASLLLEVHNEGEAIPAEQLSRLFQPLERGTQARDHGSRSIGLGLFIVDSIVNAHGGRINVRSSRESGTTFSIQLPRGD